MNTELSISTSGAGLYEFTDSLQGWLRGKGDGVVVLLVRHTSASLLVQENADADVQTDLRAFFDRLVPPSDHPDMAYLRHTYEGPDDMPAHIKAAMMPVSLSIPVQEGRAALGTWQGVYLFEHRAQPHRRRVAVSFLGTR
ncbi:secondary thiamine-phosphate synthase enzyme YjbQ [Roseobacter sp. YSTF-M11]|uniref:Secondary thiamine-phosphate synthase enzyme YjbQ n=1 Tax=Roseobacter insulae TaxID=2859783 RepID=A0A9X1K2N4_9RHOB|nr:secondary thiamine-phosphate synthase enzyme YjbQ [Roseobacter insulae]MBW4707757.1 secondary thiamine-phosphate synthase enzyme YjbQ [Roseobacter insulae]